MKNGYSLYIHFPFCNKKCTYCDFYSLTNFDDLLFKNYTNRVLDYLAYFKSNFSNTISTIYFGGGTPSILPIKYLEKIENNIQTITNDYEWTIEVNPETISVNLLDYLKNSKINRLSIGIQSTNERLLGILGRNCSFSDMYKGINLLEKYDFNNFSFDFISAIPTMTLQDLIDNIKFSEQNGAKHISIYDLTLQDNSSIYKKYGKFYDESIDLKTEDILSNSIYKQYEISNYSIPNFESKHNLAYWNMDNFFGIGLTASGTFTKDNIHYRYNSKKSLNKFLTEKIDDFYEIEEISEKDFIFEKIMMGLRLNRGISIKYLSNLKVAIEKYPNYFSIDTNLIKLTSLGRRFLNLILLEII